ncbi:MAG: serine/threonine-protein kinase PpkA [Pseudomonadota bacterium]|nr:serine/threonine-protein kinase PpkA [Pseudomonadota bacterium]
MSFQPSPPNSLLQAAEEGSRSRRSRLAQIPGYAIECEIGRGGMATVYLAVQQSLNRQVALKVLTQATEEEDDDFAQRFKKEGHILAQLLHPNIVTIHDIGITEDGDLFLSIEYLSGGTLRDKIKQGLSFDAAIEITRSIAKALDYAHKQGIIHRDIKPSNIMFRHDGTPVLTDFGIARVIGSKTIHTSAGFSIGSPGYMSPEQAMGESITIESDIYALGVVLYEMLTGHPLYESSHALAITIKH